MEHGVVVTHDPVVRVRVAGELAAVEDSRVDERRAIGRVAHVDGLTDRHVRELGLGSPTRLDLEDGLEHGAELIRHDRKPIRSSFSARRK